MTVISGYHAYQTFVALKNHFTKPSYDYVKYHGKFKVSVETYLKRKDKHFFEKLGRMVTSHEELCDHIIGNMSYGETGLKINPSKIWIGDLTTKAAKDRGLAYMARKQALDYHIKKDLTTATKCIMMTSDKSDDHLPVLLNLFYEGQIFPESLIVYNEIFNGDIFQTWTTERLAHDPIWEKTQTFLHKYSKVTFPNGGEIDRKKYKMMFKEIVKKDPI